jgi:hypothetical protein
MREVILTGPLPPAGRSWCLPCAMAWKDRAARDMLVIIETERHGHGPPAVVKLRRDDGVMPQVAVTRGLFPPLAQLGLVDLCWDCLVRVEIKQAAPAPDGGSPVPLLVPGRR